MKCCGYGWCAWHEEDCGMCVVGKMAKDVGTAVRRSHSYFVWLLF